MKKSIAILGGTFDPVHFAHLRCAMEVYEALDAQVVHFIPCKEPVHRLKPQANTEHRVKMLELALEAYPQFILDKREVVRDTPSYMFDTLTSLRQEFPDNPLVLIMGQDAFSQFHTWFHWESILNLAHIAIASRPGVEMILSPALKALLNQHEVFDASHLKQNLHGFIYGLNITALDISSTRIRNCIRTQTSVDFLLPEVVISYLKAHALYSN